MSKSKINKIVLLVVFVSLCYSVYRQPQKLEISVAKTQERTNEIVADVTATMYNAVEGQCDSDPLVTAGMYEINPKKASQHKWVALSRDLLKRWGGKFDYGDTIEIKNAGEKSGVYTVVDTMNPRFTNKIDILETKGTDLYKYENVKIVKII